MGYRTGYKELVEEAATGGEAETAKWKVRCFESC